MKTGSLRHIAYTFAAAGVAGLLSALPAAAQEPGGKPTYRVVSVSEVTWGALNPLRGAAGPRAANIWGDRTGEGATGFLVRFTDGFSSPPHIHNVTYRALVIRGLVYNGGANAEKMWMPSGSYWTQPAGGVHITSARGANNLIYVEIASGPYLVRPVGQAFESKDKPINVHLSNLVWIDQPGVSQAANGPKVAFLWGDPKDRQPSGTLIKLKPGYTGILRGHGPGLRTVIIQGRTDHQVPGSGNARSLEPGSLFSSKGKASHLISCGPGAECLLYVRSEGAFDIVPRQSTD